MDPKTILYDYAMSFVGLPYRWGGDDPVAGFDCSGLVIELMQSAGILPHEFDANAHGLWERFTAVVTEPVFGALAFYGKLPDVTHIAFCLTPDLKLEAGGGGSHTITRQDAIDQNAYIKIRPIRARTDLVGFRLPSYPWKG